MPRFSVLISCSLGSVGGNETHVLTLGNYLSKYGVKVTVATRSRDFFTSHESELRSTGVRVFTTPFNHRAHTALKNAWAAVFWPAVSVLEHFTHFVAIGPGGFHRVLKDLLSPRVMAMYWEAGDGRRSRTPNHLWMLESMDKLAATSRPVAASMKCLVDKPVGVLPPLTNIPDYDGTALRRVESPNHISVAFVGRVCELKGIDTLIDIWPTLDVGCATLDVYGDGPQLPRMRQKVRRGEKSGSIRFNGAFERASELPKIMANSDMLVLPSVTEGLPHVLIEAMAYGVPFVATDVGGVSDLIDGNPDVLVVEPSSEAIGWGIEEMARRIRSGSVFSDRLVSYYSQRFSVETVGRRWIDFLELQDMAHDDD